MEEFQSMTKEDLEAKMPQPVVAAPVRRTKVAVLGFTDSWKLAPFNDLSWEIWGLNELYMFIPRWDRWFEIHSRKLYESDKARVSDHIERLKQMTCPIYMHEHHDDIPTSVKYPLDEIGKFFPNPNPDTKPYITNTISAMIALAIYEGFEEIGIFGVDMAHDTEYCLDKNTRVLTADLRWVPLADIKVGQELLAFDEEPPVHRGNGEPAQFRKYRKATVEGVTHLTQPSYKLSMADGTTLISSVGHRWLTNGQHGRGWLETGKLQDAATYPQRVSKIVKLTDVWKELDTWDAGYLAGAFDGEGHISQGKRDNCQSSHMSIGFAQRDNAMSEKVDFVLGKLGFKWWKATPRSTCRCYNIKGGRGDMLRFLGALRPPRLMDKFDPEQVGTLNCQQNVRVLKSEFIGEHPVIGLKTSTGTFIAEGFASHNSTQRPSCEYFVGFAQGKGIKVYIPPQADLMKTLFIYGYEEEKQHFFFEKLKSRKAELAQKRAQYEQQRSQAEAAIQQYLGAEQDLDHVAKIFAPFVT